MLKTDDMIFSGARLEDVDLPRIGHQIGVGEDIIHALLDTETSGNSVDSLGRIKMLYEPHVAYKLAPFEGIRKKLVDAGLAYAKWGAKPYPRESYTRFWKAYAIDADTALKSCSWGGPQIMGSNYALAGFKSPEAMVRAMLSDEDQQLEAMVKFIVNSGLDDELKVLQAKLDKGQKITAADCVPFVRGYNGSGYAKNDYHTIFAKNLNKWAKIPDTPWSPDDPGEVDLYDGLYHPELKAIQTSLDEIGYHEVGTIDGRWGNRTATAVLAFRVANKLQTAEPKVDNEFLTTLALKPLRVIADKRKFANLNDLREEGDEAVKQVDQTKILGKVMAGIGGGGAIIKGIDQFEEYSTAIQRFTDIINPMYQTLANNWYLIPLAVGAVVIWKSGILNKIRLKKHQTGEDVSA